MGRAWVCWPIYRIILVVPVVLTQTIPIIIGADCIKIVDTKNIDIWCQAGQDDQHQRSSSYLEQLRHLKTVETSGFRTLRCQAAEISRCAAVAIDLTPPSASLQSLSSPSPPCQTPPSPATAPPCCMTPLPQGQAPSVCMSLPSSATQIDVSPGKAALDASLLRARTSTSCPIKVRRPTPPLLSLC
jgi:hypothetical protein